MTFAAGLSSSNACVAAAGSAVVLPAVRRLVPLVGEGALQPAVAGQAREAEAPPGARWALDRRRAVEPAFFGLRAQASRVA